MLELSRESSLEGKAPHARCGHFLYHRQQIYVSSNWADVWNVSGAVQYMFMWCVKSFKVTRDS